MLVKPKTILSSPSKMPGHSFSLPAGKSCPSSAYSGICQAICYAKKGRYAWPNVAKSQEDRFKWVLDSLKEDGGESFVKTMIEEIKKTGDTHFRVHDSGDLFSPAYIQAWYRIAEACPEVLFRIPTREWVRPEQLPHLQKLHSLPNVNVQPSAFDAGEAAPNVPGLGAGTTVLEKEEDLPEGYLDCPATLQHKSCDAAGCLECWYGNIPIVYRAH